MSATILFADDSPSVRVIVKGLLESAGYQTVECEDGQQAINHLSRTPVDLVITDLHMPNADGIEVIKSAREAHSPNRFTPIVMLTTEAQADRKRQGREAGATAWIVKPFDGEMLLKVAAKCLGMKRNG
jgi:two-component system chemotaxis response regulator CheY